MGCFAARRVCFIAWGAARQIVLFFSFRLSSAVATCVASPCCSSNLHRAPFLCAVDWVDGTRDSQSPLQCPSRTIAFFQNFRHSSGYLHLWVPPGCGLPFS